MSVSATRVIIGIAGVIGLLLSAERGAAQTTATSSAGQAAIEGTVFDSLTRKPLAGATISVVSDDGKPTTRSATSDANGRYTVRNLQPGVYLAGFFHPLLDSIGIEAPVQRVTVSDRSRTTRVDLAVPGSRTIHDAVCGARAEGDSSGVFVGHVRRAATRGVSVGATIGAQWTDYHFANATLSITSPTLVARTGAAGWFAFCGLPPETEIAFVAVADADSSGVITYEVPALSVVHHDFYVAQVEHVAHAIVPDSSSPDDSLPVPTEVLRRGPARLRGIVREAAHQAPLPGVQVGIAGTGLTTTTNAQGEFALAQLPPGTQTLFARKVGYFPSQQPVNLFADDSSRLVLTLPTAQSVLDTVRVTARRMYSADGDGFYRRQRSGMGRYFDADRISRMHPFRTSDILRQVPGARFAGIGPDRRVLFRGSARGACQPAIFVDGRQMHWFTLGDLDLMVPPGAVQGMEVYSSSIGLPAQFMTDFQSCGAIVVWTRTPARPRR